MSGIINPTCNNCLYSFGVKNEPMLVCYKGDNAGLYMQPTDKCKQWVYKGDAKMDQPIRNPPDLKKVVENLNDIICENCIMFAQGECRKHGSDTEPNFYCSEGRWLAIDTYFDECDPRIFATCYSDVYEQFARNLHNAAN